MNENTNYEILIYVGLVVLLAAGVLASIYGDVSSFFTMIGQEPWLIYLVVDFYVLIAVISAFVIKREGTKGWIWTLSFIITGGLGVLAYLIYRWKS